MTSTMGKIQKASGLDKFDAYMPNKSNWIQDEYTTSSNKHLFSIKSAYGWVDGHRKGFGFGVNKKLHKASSSGLMVDSYHVGKSDES